MTRLGSRLSLFVRPCVPVRISTEAFFMGIGELLLLAVGLSMDAFAVSVCKGLALRRATFKA